MSIPERRRFSRFPFHSQGTLRLAGQQRPGTVLDISLNGALFSPNAATFDSVSRHPCTLELIHSSEHTPSKLDAVIAYRRDDLVALEFLEPGEKTRQVLQTILEMNLAVDALMHRNLPDMLGHATEVDTPV